MAHEQSPGWDSTHLHDFFAVVEVHGVPEFPATEGVVVGKSLVEGNTAERWYAVMPTGGKAFMVEEQHTRATRRSVSRESIYDGSRGRVSQQGELLEVTRNDPSRD